MSRKIELRKSPIDFEPGTAWAYEETNGISVYVDKRKMGLTSFVGVISLRTIRAYMKRIDSQKHKKLRTKQ